MLQNQPKHIAPAASRRSLGGGGTPGRRISGQ